MRKMYKNRIFKLIKEIIIKNLLKSEKINFSFELINYISDQNNYSVREIQGLVISVEANSILNNRKPDIEFVKRINNKMIINNHKNRIIAK
jgi:chromosomal replication initiation ATPase DnaA